MMDLRPRGLVRHHVGAARREDVRRRPVGRSESECAGNAAPRGRALSGSGAPRPARAGATPPSPYALRTSPRAAATTGGRLPRLPAQLRPRSVRSSQDAETLCLSPQAVVAIGAASVGAQTESQRVPGLIRRRPAGQPVIMRTRICLCGCASGMRLLWAEWRLGRAAGGGVVAGACGGSPSRPTASVAVRRGGAVRAPPAPS